MSISRRIIARAAGVLCVIIVAALLWVVIYDFCSPWPASSQALKHFGQHYRFCVGISGGSVTTTVDGLTKSESSKQRAFIIMHAPIGWPEFVAISKDQDGRITVDESTFGFWVWLVFTGSLIFGAWQLLLRPVIGSRMRSAIKSKETVSALVS